jgi:hypothetical protein
MGDRPLLGILLGRKSRFEQMSLHVLRHPFCLEGGETSCETIAGNESPAPYGLQLVLEQLSQLELSAGAVGFETWCFRKWDQENETQS